MIRNEIARLEMRETKEPQFAIHEIPTGMDTRWIREGLTKAGKSQADLARHLNLTPPQVTRILAGARRIKADEINRIRQFLGLEPVAMTGGTARPPCRAAGLLMLPECWLVRG